MDDLAGKITEILKNPEMMNQIQGLMSTFGKSNSTEQDDEVNNNTQSSSFNENYEHSQEPNDDMINSIMKIVPLLSSMKNSDDKYSNFVLALRPLLSKNRQKKLDDASKILKIIKILPLLKNQGLF